MSALGIGAALIFIAIVYIVASSIRMAIRTSDCTEIAFIAILGGIALIIYSRM